MLKKYIYLMLLFTSSAGYAQIGVGKRVVDNSAIFDLSNLTNKAFLPSRVSLGALTSNSSPVSNPAEALIVYNTGTVQLPGFYIWNDGIWSLMATKSNSVTNAVITSTTTSTVLGGVANDVFVPLTVGTLSSGNSIVPISYSAGNINLPAGSYNIQVSLNITAGDEDPSLGIGNAVRTHAHFYKARLSTGANGGEMVDNATSTSSNTKQHTANFSFTFKITVPTTVIFNLAHTAGGTYANGLGGTSPNNGSINITDYYIHIQRSVL